jgi:nucleotidyltransferase substrate binding protein (TIGR01987 family)
MESENKYAIEKLETAFNQLEAGARKAKGDLQKDGVIQRFEFTFELLWKALKIFLEYKGVTAKTPRDCLKESFRIDLINDEETFLNMLEDRNLTSHIYDKETSGKIFKRIKKNYITAIKKLIESLKRETVSE